MTGRLRRGARSALPIAVALSFVAAEASARPFTTEYRWPRPDWGAQPWFPAHYTGPEDADLIGEAGPWYTTTFRPGVGLRIVPTGNGGAPYDGVRGLGFLAAPGGAQWTRAVLTGVDGMVEERQLLRLALRDFDGTIAGVGASEDRVPDGSTFSDDTVTLTPTAGARADLLSLNMFTAPCGGAGEPACQPVDPAAGGFLQVGGVRATFEDPSAPVARLTGEGLEGRWTRARRLTILARAEDPQSGIAELQVRAASAGASVTRPREDVRQLAPRDRLAPPRPPMVERSRTVALGRARSVRVRLRAVNGARMRQATDTTIRVDRDPPRGLRVTRTDQGRLVAEGRDARSGVASLTLELPRDVTVVGPSCDAANCPERVRTASTAPPIGMRVRVVVRARDRAGNTARRAVTVRGAADAGTATPPAACTVPGRTYDRVLSGQRRLRGNGTAELLLGARDADRLDGAGGGDCVAGARGDDALFGGSGADVLEGGSGADLVEAGSGDDLVLARDGRVDEVDCGGGEDRAILDPADDAAGCEREDR